MSILIKGALLDGADQVIDGRRKALIPGFVNAHTHAAMTLFVVLAMTCR